MDKDNESLSDVCGPLLLVLATFRRNADSSTLEPDQLRQALQRELESARRRSESDRRLSPLFERVWYPLVATADQVVLTSGWSKRGTWSMNLLEQHYFGTSEGGKKFYRVVEEVLADPTDAAAELAEVLFTCMSLGFQGELLGERKELERRRRLLFEKARLPGSLGDTLAPQCYGRNVARRAVDLPTATTLRLALIAVGALLIAVIVSKGSTVLKTDEYVDPAERIIEELTSPR